MKYEMNIVDMSGSVKTGYEEILEGTTEECITDYVSHLVASNAIEEVNGKYLMGDKNRDLDIDDSRIEIQIDASALIEEDQ